MSVPTSGQSTDPKIWAIAVWGLYLAGLVSGITALIGLILAYVKRGEARPAFQRALAAQLAVFKENEPELQPA